MKMWMLFHLQVQLLLGKQMYENAATSVKQVVLELGGKSPLVYLKGGDLRAAVKQSMDTILNNQGQTCTALTRLLSSRR